MSSRLHDTVLQVADLVDRPGTSRRVQLALPAPADLDLPLTSVVEPVRLDGEIASVVEGLLVRGMLRADLRMQCSRCLTDLGVEVAADVTELFINEARIVAPAAEVEEGYEIRDAAIDLDTLVRDALVPAVPYQALCESACRGLCPTCGVNLNEVAGDHGHEPVGDPRWAALETLRLPPDD